MLVILGDLHLRADKDYFIATCECFLDWFKNWKYNNQENELILAGDLVEQAAPGGITISFLERLAIDSKFKHIHICVGNHDNKKINGISQLAYEFLDHKSNITIYRNPKEVTIQGKKALILPYFLGLNDLDFSMKEYYSNIYRNKKFSNDYDLVVGHFSGDDVFFSDSPDCVSNLDKLTGRVCLGHIHTREINPNRYIGSVFAGKKNENDDTRAAWILDGDTWFEDKLPLFNEFVSVVYPNEIPPTSALIPIYTVLNCNSETLARQTYGNIYIRKVTSSTTDISSKEDYSVERSFNAIKEFDIKSLFEDFLKSRTTPFKDRVAEKCRTLIQGI